MTGLDIDRGDRLLEVACIITDGDLNPVDEGVSYVISTSKDVLDSMNAWYVVPLSSPFASPDPLTHSSRFSYRCVNQHGLSGLTSACLSSTTSYPHASVRAALLAYIRDRVPTPNAACLAGNTVHADKVFLVKEMPELIQHLHYRIVDVSSIKELVRRWYGSEEGMTWRPRKEGEEKKGDHRALNDIRASIDELRWYREKVFRQPAK